MNTAETLFFNRASIQNTSGLRNPVVKFLLLFLPLIFVAYQQIGRAIGLPRMAIKETLLIATFVWIAVHLNFAQKERPRMLRRGVGGAVFFFGIYYVTTNAQSTIASVLGIFWKTYSSIPILRGVAAESWLYLVFFYIAILAVRGFSTREALWLGRRVLWNYWFIAYAVTVVTFAVINSALPLRMTISWRIARDKMVLLKNPYLARRSTAFDRLGKGAWLFASTLIGSNSAIAQTVEILMEQRGFFRTGYQDRIGREFGPEDCVVVVLLFLLIFVLVLGRVH